MTLTYINSFRGEHIWEAIVLVYWTLVQYGGGSWVSGVGFSFEIPNSKKRCRALRGKIRVPRHSLLDTHSYFGGSCVPTMTVRTVVPSGFALYLTRTNRVPFV